MTDKGDIYIMHKYGCNQTLNKIGMTKNKKATLHTYGRCGNIYINFYPVDDHLSQVEAAILNLLIPYRTKRNNDTVLTNYSYTGIAILGTNSKSNNKSLTEEVNLDTHILDSIIKICIDYSNFIDKNISVCRSITTTNHRKIMDALFLTHCCIYLIDKFNVNMASPMEICDSETISHFSCHYTIDDFDKIMNTIVPINVYL